MYSNVRVHNDSSSKIWLVTSNIFFQKCGQMVDAKWGYSLVNAFKYVGMLGDLIFFTLCNSFLAGEVSFLFHPKECIPYIIVTPCKLYFFEEEKPIVLNLKLERQKAQNGQLHTHGDPYISMVQ